MKINLPIFKDKDDMLDVGIALSYPMPSDP